ncbi:hypothetical protein BGZ96_012470, partial [Linnemannia gamsii]
MRILSITLAVSLALVTMTKAAPMPMPMPALDENPNFDENQEQFACLEQCLQVEQQCLLVSNSMHDCYVAFDSCHGVCYPEVAHPDDSEPPVTPAPAVPGPGDNQINQITESDLTNPAIDDTTDGADETDDTTDGAEETDDTTDGAEETDDSTD